MPLKVTVEEAPKINIKDVDITQFPKLEKLSHGNFEAYGSEQYTFYVPNQTEIELTEEEKKWLEYKPTMANIDFSREASPEMRTKIEKMDKDILESYKRNYRCTKEQYIYIYSHILSNEPKIKGEWNEEIGSKIDNFHNEFILKYFGLSEDNYRKMREIEFKVEDFYKDLEQTNLKNEKTLKRLLNDLEYVGIENVYEGLEWLSNPENRKLTEQYKEYEKNLITRKTPFSERTIPHHRVTFY